MTRRYEKGYDRLRANDSSVQPIGGGYEGQAVVGSTIRRRLSSGKAQYPLFRSVRNDRFATQAKQLSMQPVDIVV